MRMPHKTYCLVITTLLLCLMQAVDGLIHAQERPRVALKREHAAQVETASDSASLALQADTIAPVHAFGTGDSLVVTAQADSIAAENKRKLLELTAVPTTGATEMPADTLLQSQLNRKMWVPNPTKATWLALVIPGGGQIYRDAMEYADTLLITHVKATIDEADTFFPEIDSRIWEMTECSETFTDAESGYSYEFMTYRRRQR